jgi:hypothetical protein
MVRNIFFYPSVAAWEEKWSTAAGNSVMTIRFWPKQALWEHMPSNKALQTDKAKLTRLLLSQKPCQLAFAAELGC